MGTYQETGWTLPERETIHITVPSELARELEAVAREARSTPAAVIADVLSDAAGFGLTASREATEIPAGGVGQEISLDPQLREDLEKRLADLRADGKDVDLSAVIAAILLLFLRKQHGALSEEVATRPAGIDPDSS